MMNLVRSIILLSSVIVLFSTTSCKAQVNKDKGLIKTFFLEILNKDSLDFERFKQFVPLHETLNNNENFKKLMNYTFSINKKINNSEPGEYRIVAYNEINEFPKLKKSKSYEKLDYAKKDNVYYALKSDQSENVYIFIIEKGQIVSFFPYIHIGADRVKPFKLNEKANDEYLKTINGYIGL